jgi:sugar/nucleoside kinase (ribokinase family)
LYSNIDDQYVLPPNSVVYTGCVGDDELAEQLRAANKREGLADAYMVKKGEKTGACAVVITGHHRCVLAIPYLKPSHASIKQFSCYDPPVC